MAGVTQRAGEIRASIRLVISREPVCYSVWCDSSTVDPEYLGGTHTAEL